MLVSLPSCAAQTAQVVSDNTASAIGGASFTGTMNTVTAPSTPGTAICNGMRIGTGLTVSSAFILRELDVGYIPTARTTETTGYPLYFTLELWPMSSSTTMTAATPGTPLGSTTVVGTTLPGNIALPSNPYMNIALNNAFELKPYSNGTAQSYLLTIMANVSCALTLKLQWPRPTLTPTAPNPASGVTGEPTALRGFMQVALVRLTPPSPPPTHLLKGVTYGTSAYTTAVNAPCAPWTSFTASRPWWRLTAYSISAPVWTTIWLDSTARLTAARITASPITVGTKVAAWCIRAPADGSGVFNIWNISIVRAFIASVVVCVCVFSVGVFPCTPVLWMVLQAAGTTGASVVSGVNVTMNLYPAFTLAIGTGAVGIDAGA